MTDKEQIIIDGVDVSGCLFYQSNFEEDYDVRIKHFCSNWHNSCESSNNSNCYFKQLDRYRKALEEIEEVLKVDFQLPCASTVCSYPETCKDSLTNHGTECMRFALLKIKDIVKKAKGEE